MRHWPSAAARLLMSAALLRRKFTRSSLHDSQTRVIDLPVLFSMMKSPLSEAPCSRYAEQKAPRAAAFRDKETQRLANQLNASPPTKDNSAAVSAGGR